MGRKLDGNRHSPQEGLRAGSLGGQGVQQRHLDMRSWALPAASVKDETWK